MVTIDPHPLLDAKLFCATLPRPLGGWSSPPWLTALLAKDAPAPLHSDDSVRAAVRDVLRHAGFKPTGRSKPASEYLARAAEEGGLRSINPAVDGCNVVSLHSGLPISVIDLERARPPLRISVAPPGTRYVFNTSGQEIDVGDLVCLFDAEGPCANAVKDAQRTKTSDATTRLLAVVWGAATLAGRADQARAWYVELLTKLEARTELL